MTNAIGRSIEPLARRFKLALSTARLMRSAVKGGVVSCEVELLSGETRRALPLVQHPGISSRPVDGARLLVAFPGGERRAGVVIGVQDPLPDDDLEPGETKIHAPGGSLVHLRADGTLGITGDTSVEGDVSSTGNLADFRSTLEQIRLFFDTHSHSSPGSPPTIPMIPGARVPSPPTSSFVEAGIGSPQPSEREPGATYVDLLTGTVYQHDGTAWAPTGESLRGPIGDAGPTGEAGPKGQDGAAGATGPPGTTDHGLQTGLGDDDHAQYHTAARALAWLGAQSADVLPEGVGHLFLTAAERAHLVQLPLGSAEGDSLEWGRRPADIRPAPDGQGHRQGPRGLGHPWRRPAHPDGPRDGARLGWLD